MSENQLVYIPLLYVNFTVGTTQECMRSVCWDELIELRDYKRCPLEPRFVEGRIWNASKRGDCPEDRASFISAIELSGRARGYGIGRGYYFDYQGTCTFTSRQCAVQVCSEVNKTPIANTSNNEFMCASDPAVAAAAVDGTYWFDPNAPRNSSKIRWTIDPSLPCRGEKPSCKGVTYLGSDGKAIISQAAPVHRPSPLVLLALASGFVTLLTACGITGA